MPLNASRTSGQDWRDLNLWRCLFLWLFSAFHLAAKIELQDIMKDVLPDMSKGYSDKLESKVGAIAAIRNRFDLRFDTRSVIGKIHFLAHIHAYICTALCKCF